MNRDREWQKVVDAKSADVMWECHDWEHDVHGYVVRGPAALCGYVGTRKDHGVWKCASPDRAVNGYDAFYWIRVHGGMTYMGDLDATKVYNPDYVYIGWDYAHAGDRTTYDDAYLPNVPPLHRRKWTVPEVAAHVLKTMRVFTNYKKLIEAMEAGLCDERAIELFKQLEQ